MTATWTAAPEVSNETRHNLITLLSDGHFHSGEKLAAKLGISRNAIWKQVKNLDALGIEVFAVQGKGYRLRDPIELLSRSMLLEKLDPLVRDRIENLQLLEETDSTNVQLASQVAAQPGHARVCVAEYQTSGRGRLGRNWQSPYASGLLLSVGWCFAETPPAIQALSLAIGVGVKSAMGTCGIDAVGLKWPNDLVCNHGKLGGILVELQGEVGGPAYVIIGIGINYRFASQVADDMHGVAAADLYGLAGDGLPGRNVLLAAILNSLVTTCETYERSGFASFVSEWRAADAFKGLQVDVLRGNESVSGIARGVDSDGALLLEINGINKRFVSGEVSLREANR